MGYTRGHLHERVEGHARRSSSIYKHYNLQHNSEMPERFIEQFHIITKCSKQAMPFLTADAKIGNQACHN